MEMLLFHLICTLLALCAAVNGAHVAVPCKTNTFDNPGHCKECHNCKIPSDAVHTKYVRGVTKIEKYDLQFLQTLEIAFYVLPAASDNIRVFRVAYQPPGGQSTPRYWWLSGNGHGNGTSCKAPVDSLADNYKDFDIYEFPQKMPADQY